MNFSLQLTIFLFFFKLFLPFASLSDRFSFTLLHYSLSPNSIVTNKTYTYFRGFLFGRRCGNLLPQHLVLNRLTDRVPLFVAGRDVREHAQYRVTDLAGLGEGQKKWRYNIYKYKIGILSRTRINMCEKRHTGKNIRRNNRGHRCEMKPRPSEWPTQCG